MSKRKFVGWATPLPMLLWIPSTFILLFAVAQAEIRSSPSQRASSRIRPVDLRCEYLSAPLGIDVEQPRLSWKLKAKNPKERGQTQTVYQILVASSRKQLARDEGNLWDSGEVQSDQSHLIPYGGTALSSDMRCYWKVRVRDERGTLSSWSAPAQWTMGCLEPSDWTAKWIGSDETFTEVKTLPPDGDYLSDPWLRKVVELNKKPRWATIHIASVGYHELYVNGKKVTDTVLMPNVADHTKRARYVTYDITKQLRSGRNTIGLWLGTSWSVYPLYKTEDKPQTPIVAAQAHIEMPDGQVRRVVTDETWKTHPSPNVMLGTWMFTNFGGEYYDANKEMPDWCSADLDDSNWKPATVYQPELTISAEIVEPNRRIGVIKPVGVEEIEGQGYRVDMGVNFAGFVELDVKGQPGDIIELLFSEDQKKMITHKLRSAYRIGPSGRGTFRNRFNYGSGRWILIKGLGYKPALKDIRGHLVRTDYRRAGWFECSNKLLNDIYNIVLWTYENLSVGAYVVDCPQRERMGYGGDAHATTQTAMNNYHLGAFYTKWSQDWRDVQGKDTAWGLGEKATNQNAPTAPGNLPYTAPTYWGGGGPAWSGICVTLPSYMYRHYGDRRILEENFVTIRRWLEFLETKSKNDMLVRWGGKWDFLGDWLWPGAQGVNGDTRETLFFNNCYWIYNLKTAARIAEVLNKKDAAVKYRRRAETVRRAVHEEFFDPNENGYVNNLQAYLASALLVGLPPKELQPKVWKRFEDEILIHREGHFWGGITGGYFIVKNLIEFDRPDLMFEMATKEDYPGWGDMLNRGATTVWEAWDGRNSLLHSSYLHIGAWFIEGLAGIRPDPEGPGYKRFIIKPGVLEDQPLDWVKARFESPYGMIRSQWRLRSGKLTLRVSVPPNTTATLYVPTKNPESIKEGQLPLLKVPGIKHLRDEKGRSVLELQPGRYTFESALYKPTIEQLNLYTDGAATMKEQSQTILSRRQFMSGAAALAASTVMSRYALGGAAGKPNSNFHGVQIGAITYSFRSMPGSAEDILKYAVQCGLSSLELMGGPAEQFAGIPSGGGRGRRRQMNEAQRKWRLAASMDKYRALRKMYNDAGVKIHIVKFGSIGNANMPDAEIDYYFNVAKALGAKGITREISEDAARRLGPIADRHKIMIGFHNHTQITPTTYDGPILSYGNYLGINLDIGHFVAGTNASPIPLIRKHHDRILSLHLKDRKVNNGPNMPFGQGDTPVALVLQLMKKEGWTFPADIELEYKIPAGSNAVAEVKKCVEFCREALA